MIVDRQIRERAIREIDVSMALSAGAGSGKTSVLVARVLEALASGTVEPDRLAVITFTEKAASELQERVRDGLERLLAAGERESGVLYAALNRFGDVTLSTIHSFCRTLLHGEALESGWAPDTEMTDDALALPQIHQVWRQWYDGFKRRYPRVAPLVDLCTDRTRLKKAAGRLLVYQDLSPSRVELHLDPEEQFELLKAQIQELERLLVHCKRPESCKLIETNASLFSLLRQLGRSSADAALAVALKSDLKGNRRYGKSADWTDGAHSEVKQLIGDYAEWKASLGRILHGVVLGDLSEHFVPAVLAAKQRFGAADFDDLLFRAAALLTEQADVRQRLSERYDKLFIDEVQDTDPIQARVAVLLTRSIAHRGSWDDHPPEPGRLFAVGDPKQSIYRFRRADVEIWDQLKQLIADDGETASLRQNFRSVPGLVNWFNHTFSLLPDYTDQVAYRQPASLQPVVVLKTDPENEIDAVLRHLLQLQRRGGQVVDRESGESRPLRWSDVMLLLPAWTKAGAIQQMFSDAGVPCIVEGGRSYFNRDEVRLTIAALKAIDEPADGESIVFVLRGLYGFDHQALAEHVANGGGWRYTVPNQPSGPAAEVFQLLKTLHNQRSRRSLVSLLDQLLAHSQICASWSLLPDGLSRLANLDKLRVRIRELEQQYRTPGEVIAQLAIGDDWQNAEGDLSLADSDYDAVRVTTLFGAKGLEAPLVVILCAKRALKTPDAIVDRHAGKVAINISGKLKPPLWKEASNREKEALTQERRRWMYVAATRARDQLIITDPGGKTELLDVDIRRGMPDPGEAEQMLEEVASGAMVRTILASSLPEVNYISETFPGCDDLIDQLLGEAPPEGDQTGQRFREHQKQNLRAATRKCVRWRNVHDVIARRRSVSARSFEPPTHQSVGTDGGTLIHEVMALLDLRRPDDELRQRAIQLIDALGQEAGLEPQTIDDCQAIIARILADRVIGLARRATVRWQEVPFAVQDRGRIIAGTIDLCFPLDDERRRWMVVDWKSRIPPVGSAQRQQYDDQLAEYAKALLKTAGCEEVETALVGPHPELGQSQDEWQELMSFDELVPLLERLLVAGLPPFDVGPELGELGAAEPELAWLDSRFCILIDRAPEEFAALQPIGWDGVAVQRDDSNWLEQIETALVERFGLQREPDDEE